MAAPILAYEELGLIQGEGWLFRGLDLYIAPRDRLALIGRNGAGKTTLLKCLAGLIDTDAGKRTIVPGTHVVLLEQDPAMPGSKPCATGSSMGPTIPRRTRRRRSPTGSESILRGRWRRPAAASGAERRSLARWRRSRTCCCSMSRPTTSTSAQSNGSRIGSSASP